MQVLKSLILMLVILNTTQSIAAFCDDNPNDLLCLGNNGEGILGGLGFGSGPKNNDGSEHKSNNKISLGSIFGSSSDKTDTTENNESNSFCSKNPNDLLCLSGLSDLTDEFSSDGLSLKGVENGLTNLGSSIKEGISDLGSGITEFGGNFFDGALETVSEILGNGEIFGLTKDLIKHIAKSNYHYKEALGIQTSAEIEKALVACMGEKICSSKDMDRIISLSDEILAEVEKLNKEGAKLDAKALVEFEKGNIETSKAWVQGGVVLAQFALAAQTASVSCSQIGNHSNNETPEAQMIKDIFNGVACAGSIAVIADITGSVKKFYDAIKTRGESKDLYELSKANGIQPPQESGPT